GGDALAADHLATAVRLVPGKDRRLAERPVQMRLDHLQRKTGGCPRVECIAALFQNAHADRRSNPVGRGDDPKGAADLGPGSEGTHCVSPEWFRNAHAGGGARQAKLPAIEKAAGQLIYSRVADA